jgi:hypothetical protein
MMYIEQIADNEDKFRIERQKDKPDGRWYALSLNSSPHKRGYDNC